MKVLPGNFFQSTGTGLRIAAILFTFFFTLSCGSGNRNEENGTSGSATSIPSVDGEYFQDITEPSGIDFIHTIGDRHLSNLVESVGGGAAFLDYDQDGFLDLYVVNGAHVKDLSAADEPLNGTPVNELYHNLRNGTFGKVTGKSRTGDAGYGMGVTIGDFDNDGFPDIYVSNYGPNILYHNNRDGTFTDVAGKAGVAGATCSVGAVFLDYDNDGYLDLYVGNYIKFDPQYNYYYAPDGFPGPMAYDGEPDRMYHNNGNGTFRDVTEEMGLFNPEGRAMGVGAADYNNDGWVDIYVANDHMVNFLFENQAGKLFKDMGIPSGTAFNQVGEATISMAVDFADYNNDGLLDLFVSDDGYCSLFENRGDGIFNEMSYNAGIAAASGQRVGWGTAFFDYDNDGDKDIFKTNGELKHLYGEEDQLFENDGSGKFTDVSVEKGNHFFAEKVGRGAAFGDYDNDGDIDIYIVNLNDRGIFLRNNKGSTGNWITLQLTGTTSNRDAIGTRVKLTASGKTQVEQRKGGCGYLSYNDARIHFGLGTAENIEKIEINWPSGKNQILVDVKPNQILSVTEE